MKKLLAIVLAVLSAFSMTAVAYADNTTELTTTVPDATYTLNIPADQEIAYGATNTKIGEVSVTGASGFAKGKNLYVTISHGAFVCPDVSTTIPFKVGHMEDQLSYGYKFKESNKKSFWGLANGTVEEAEYPEVYIAVESADWGKALAGKYSATITFTAEVNVAN